MNEQQIINNKENINIKYRIMLIFISILPLLFAIILFILSLIDERGCDGMFGLLSDYCAKTNYFLWAFFSIPFVILSLVGGLLKKMIVAIVGAILFLGFNFRALIVSNSDVVKVLSIISIIISGVLLLFEIFLFKKKTFNRLN